ncbi:MAG TPA: hypothetical protein VEL76_21170 [Gemmataceae bacterium]|nr:hypothetical protein [Gemmataceae bacterium]
MITLTADDTTLLKQVGTFLEPIEIYDNSGKLLGLFVPANLEQCKEKAAILAKVDWDEIERRRQSNEPTFPFKDTRARLKRLDEEVNRRKMAGEKEFTTEEGLTYFHSLRQEASTTAVSPPEGEGEIP